MDIDSQIRIIILVVLLIFSAFFSASEVALFSLDKRKLKKNLDLNPFVGRYLLNLIEHPRRLLVSILIGNTIANVSASIVAVSIALDITKTADISQEYILTLQIIILTVVIILFCELTPKIWAARSPLTFARIASVPLYWFTVIIFPVAESLTEIIRMIISKVKIDQTKAAISADEITELAELGHEMGTLQEEEHGIIQSIVSFKSVTVLEVMTPRVDMVAVASDIQINDLIEVIKSSGHSRIPVYRNSLDEIIGIIYAKDVLAYLRNTSGFDLMKLARKALFAPKTKMINDMMYELQEKKMHIAIVVDEFGGTAGLVTLEDIIEEIIGEIRDEYDKEENPVTKIDENKYLVLGRISLEELNELLNTNILSGKGDYETLAGLVLNFAGYIPKEGYNFNLENFKFTVKEVSRKRINRILIEKESSE